LIIGSLVISQWFIVIFFIVGLEACTSLWRFIGKAISLGDLLVRCLNRLIAAKRQIKKCNKNHFFL